MGTFGDASGIVMVIPAFGQPGKILGLHDGNLQAYLDSDGTLKWAGGKGVADATGISHTVDASNYWKVEPTSSHIMTVSSAGRSPAGTSAAIVAYETSGTALLGFALTTGYGVYGSSSGGTGGRFASSAGLNFPALIGASTQGGAGVKGIASPDSHGISYPLYDPGAGGVLAVGEALGPTPALVIQNGIVDGGSQRYTAMGNATADTDGLNRITADARYAAIAGAHAAITLDVNADTLLSLSTQALGLDTQTTNYIFAGPATGGAAVPTFRALVAADMPATYLLATGATTGASSQAQTFTNGIVGPSWKPAADSTTALQMQQAGGTAVITVDTTNSFVAIGTSAPIARLDMGLNPGSPGNLAISNYAFVGQIYSTGNLVFGYNVKAYEGTTVAAVVANTNAVVGYNAISIGFDGVMDGIKFYTYTGSVTAGDTIANERLRITKNGTVGIGTAAPGTMLHTLLTDSGTDAVVDVATLGHDTSGTAANGFGAGLALQLESSTTAAQAAARVVALWNDATHATRKADLVLYTSDSAGEREGVRLRGNGSAAAIGFLGAAPVVRQTGCAVPTTLSECITAIGALRTALNNLGLTTGV